MNPAANSALRKYVEGFLLPCTMLRLLLIIILFLLLLGSLPTWGYASGWGTGYYLPGGFGLLLIIILVLFLVDRRGMP